MRTNLGRGATVLAGALLVQAALADFSLYDQDGYRLSLQLELQGAVFNGQDSWFGAAEEFLGENVDHWAETAVELGFSGEVELSRGKLIAELSGVATRTYGEDGSGLGIGFDSPNEFRMEQGHLGWQSGADFLGVEEGGLTVKAGRFDYNIGTGLLINDGGGDGGKRGGWWIGARKAFRKSFLATLDTGPLLVEGFFLQNQPRSGGPTGEVFGTNVEYEFESIGVTLGGTFLRVQDRGSTFFPDFDTISVRAAWETPLQGLSFDGEVVEQSDDSDGEAFWIRGAYQWEEVSWQPELSYRFAHLSGDDPDTAADERFRPIAYGFTDYGFWYQGEIAGGLVLENSNLDSHMVRLQLSPTEDITLNVLYYNFTLDQLQIFGDPVDGDDFGDEVNLSMDWAVNDNLFVIFTLGALFPGAGAKSWTGGDKDWLHSMVYGGYEF